MSTSQSEDALIELARLELFQGLETTRSSERRRQLYELFGSPDESWVTKAQAAYAAMARSGGYVASVGDQLSAEVDILENAEMYAAVGGFDVSEITTGLGSWWSPSATWFSYGRFLASPGLQRTLSGDDLEYRQLLLRAGALALARFYDAVANGGLRLTGSVRLMPNQRMRRREIAFLIGVLISRRSLFVEGPGEDGRYFHTERLSSNEILQAAQLHKASEKRDAPASV